MNSGNRVVDAHESEMFASEKSERNECRHDLVDPLIICAMTGEECEGHKCNWMMEDVLPWWKRLWHKWRKTSEFPQCDDAKHKGICAYCDEIVDPD